MSSNEQDNMTDQGYDLNNPFKNFNPFGFAFGGRQQEKQQASFDDIMKEFDEFFKLDKKDVKSKSRQATERNPAQGAYKAKDIFKDIRVDLVDAFNGCKQNINYLKVAICSTCKGKRSKPGAKTETCARCKGEGSIIDNHQSGIAQVNCPDC